MFGALLIAGLVSAPLGTIGLLTRARRPDRTVGAWPSARRFALAIAGTLVLAAIVAGVLKLLSESESNIIAGAAGITVGSLVWLPVTRRWTARAHLCWAASIFLFVIYLAFVLDWIFTSHLGVASTARRPAAVALPAVRGPAGLRLPVGNLRRPRLGAVGQAGDRHHDVPGYRCRASLRQLARAGA